MKEPIKPRLRRILADYGLTTDLWVYELLDDLVKVVGELFKDINDMEAEGEQESNLAPRTTKVLNNLSAGDSNEGLDVIQAYVDGVLKTETEWAKARGDCGVAGE